MELFRTHGPNQAAHVGHADGLIETDGVEDVEGCAGVPTLEVTGVQAADGSHDLGLADGG